MNCWSTFNFDGHKLTIFFFNLIWQCQVMRESGVAELVSAMAAGWSTQLIVETWSEGGAIAASIGLAIARGHTGGRHVCIVPDERSRLEYGERMGETGLSTEVVVGEVEEVMAELEGIDFMVVDCRGREEFSKVLRVARLSDKGAVLLCKNANSRSAAPGFKWRNVLEGGSRRLVRSVFLPVGKGLDIAHVSSAIKAAGSYGGRGGKRWIKHVDQQSGEVHVIRRQ